MLRGSFFIIEQFLQEENTATAVVKINGQHPVFLGHFPEQPVVPGVFTLQMVKECLEQALGRPVRFTVIQNCKFSNVMTPGGHALIEVICNYERNDNNVRLNASVKSGDVTYLSLKAQAIMVNEN
jgi:3-hydroxyacyl-[acyl-carrier-protein] dehydratase